MSEPLLNRRLAAILIADVVGFTRLVEIDEVATLRSLSQWRTTILDQQVRRFDGRVVKNTGDGALVEFASAVNAVSCAMAMQPAMAETAEGSLAGSPIILRIGINLGDVVIDGDDIYGDGVNIAARIEQACRPGEVAISASVYEQVRRKIDAHFEDRGPLVMKNVTEPVRVYRVLPAGTLHAPTAAAHRPSPARKPTIAVLPFVAMGTPDAGAFAEGFTEDLITALSTGSPFDVVARTSTSAYKGAVDIRKISSELDAEYVFEGSIRRAGDRARVTVQLVDGPTGHHLWAEKHDLASFDDFDLQDQTIRAIAASAFTQLYLAPIVPAEGGAANQRAARLAMQARGRIYDQTPEAYAEARRLADEAIELDPHSALAHLARAMCFLSELEMRILPPTAENFAKTIALSRAAVAMAPRDAYARFILGASLREAGHHDEAIDALEIGLQLDPHLTLCYSEMAVCNMTLGRTKDAVDAAQTVLRLNPRDPTNHWMHYVIAGCAYIEEDYAKAVSLARKISYARPEFLRVAIVWLASASAAGLPGEIASAREKCLSLAPHIRAGTVAPDHMAAFARSEDQARLIDHLSKGGLPE